MSDRKSPLEMAVGVGELLVAVAALAFTWYSVREQHAVNVKQDSVNKRQIELVQQQMDRTDEAAAYGAFFDYQGAVAAAAGDRGSKEEMLKNRALATAERIYQLRGADSAWRSTVASLVRNRALGKGDMNCDRYSSSFVIFVRDSVLHVNPCANRKSEAVQSGRPAGSSPGAAKRP
jgi:hypothetical protein